MVSILPTVFHVTHYKAGSQWVLQVLKDAAPDRIVDPHVNLEQFFQTPIVAGAIYPTIYTSYARFREIIFPPQAMDASVNLLSGSNDASSQNWKNFSANKYPVKTFVVIRDLRDTLISLYFSVKVSHALVSEQLAEGRRELMEADFEHGFLQMMAPRGENQTKIQLSWLPACQRGEAMLFRYEDMIADEIGQFEKIFKHCEINISRPRLHEIVEKNSFVKLAGRKPGQEDIQSHFRKGISGDWKNYFTERIKTEFKTNFGQALIETGYETDQNW